MTPDDTKDEPPGTSHDPRATSPEPQATIHAIVQAIQSIAPRHREDAWQQAFAAHLTGEDAAQAVRDYAEKELGHEVRQRTEQALTDVELAGALQLDPRALKQLKDICERLLGEYPESAQQTLRRKQDERANANQRPGRRILKDKIYARDIAAWLGISRSVALRKMRKWSVLYGIVLLRDTPGNKRSPVSMTRTDLLKVLRREPQLSYARRHRRRGRRKPPKVVHTDDLSAVCCPDCGSRQVICKKTCKTHRYYLCLRCAERKPRIRYFKVM